MLEYASGDSFTGILVREMKSLGVGCMKLEEMLIEEGITDISFKRISEYTNGLHTPSFERAKVILKTLKCPISDEEIAYAIKVNKEYIKENTAYVVSGNKEMVRSIRIKLKNLLPDRPAEETERFLSDRINELYGDEKQLTMYINGLIAKDLKKYILSREEFEDVNQSNSSN